MKKHNIDLDLLHKSLKISKDDEDMYLRWNGKFYYLVLDEHLRRYQKKHMDVDLSKLNIY